MALYKGIRSQQRFGLRVRTTSIPSKRCLAFTSCLGPPAAKPQGMAEPPLPQEKQGPSWLQCPESGRAESSLRVKFPFLSGSSPSSTACFLAAPGTCHSLGRHLAFIDFSAQMTAWSPFSSCQVGCLTWRRGDLSGFGLHLQWPQLAAHLSLWGTELHPLSPGREPDAVA